MALLELLGMHLDVNGQWKGDHPTGIPCTYKKGKILNLQQLEWNGQTLNGINQVQDKHQILLLIYEALKLLISCKQSRMVITRG